VLTKIFFIIYFIQHHGLSCLKAIQSRFLRCILRLSCRLDFHLVNCLFPSCFSTKTIIYRSLRHVTCHMPCPSHAPWYHYPNNIRWAVHIMKFLIMQSSPFPSYFVPLRPIYLLQTQFSNIFSLYSSLNVRDRVWHPQRRGTARTLPNFCDVLCIVCFVSFSVLFVCVYVYCTTATGWLPNCS